MKAIVSEACSVCLACNASLACLTGTMSIPIECVMCGYGEIIVLNQVKAHEPGCRIMMVPKECPHMINVDVGNVPGADNYFCNKCWAVHSSRVYGGKKTC